MHKNAERFQHLLATDKALRDEIQKSAQAYHGNPQDDRAVFEAVIAPVAAAVGIALTYDEMREAALDGRDLADEELEMITGGAGVLYRKLVSGALAATLIFGSVPVQAFAEQASPSSASAQSELVVDQNESAALANYNSNFSMSDIAMPSGLSITNGKLSVSPGASAALKDAAADVEAKDGDDKKDNKGSENDMDWDMTDKGAEYAAKALRYVGGEAEKVFNYGKKLYDLIKSCATGDFEGIFGGVEDFLNILGIMGSDDEAPKAVTNEDLMEEMKNLNALMDTMREELNANTQQTYKNRLERFGTSAE